MPPLTSKVPEGVYTWMRSELGTRSSSMERIFARGNSGPLITIRSPVTTNSDGMCAIRSEPSFWTSMQ
ncbi:hypothetical protein FGO68_gene17384 [Halteria grandinella]|uniref:Uncharacterized protein n=1 Tax=Halteria grandinella TaxID=5974 RepID=A0A8J8SWZ8_HALGN|nr:hypothetical protein FGO68_gene17384 [Halteria grandinella]